MTTPPRPLHRPPPLWTIQELADYLVLPISTLYRLRHTGDGPRGRRLGKHLRFDQAEVAAWLNVRRDDSDRR